MGKRERERGEGGKDRELDKGKEKEKERQRSRYNQRVNLLSRFVLYTIYIYIHMCIFRVVRSCGFSNVGKPR